MRFFPVLLAAAFSTLLSGQTTSNYDLVIYGATASGVATAVSAARQGLKVALIEPTRHVGGMATGGLSMTDFGRKEVIGGFALEFYTRLGRYYNLSRFSQTVAWYYEPHVGEEIFNAMLREARVSVFFSKRLREKAGVQKSGTRIVSITTDDATVFSGKVFADCSYEGDLLPQAGISYTYGRESTAQYGEALAGVRDRTPYHQFLFRVSPRDAKGKLLPEVDPGPKAQAGSADKKVQAYNFRMSFTDDPANQVAYPKPEKYDAHRYELLARYLAGYVEKNGHPPTYGQVISIGQIPNHKADINNNGPFSTDYIGKSWDYPEANYARREEIFRDHVEYTKGFFWFLAHDPRVPAVLQTEVNNWGLSKDEFEDSEHWPRQLYIREARRMVGEFVVTQKDLQTDLEKPDAIGMGSYNSDSHNVQRIATPDGAVENEGDMQVAVKPYRIPYRVMLPKAGESENLLVPVCFSASHVAYSSLRMEPQYMIIGQAAGVAAAIAIRAHVPVQKIDVEGLQKRLKAEKAIF